MSHVDEETHRGMEGKSAVRVVNAHQSKVLFVIAVSTYTDSTLLFSCLMEKKETKASECKQTVPNCIIFSPHTPTGW